MLYVKNLSLLDSPLLTFYASLLHYNNLLDQAYEVANFALKKNPYSTKAIFVLCDLIQIKYQDMNKIEELSLSAFKYFPYDAFTLFVMKKIYEVKGDFAKFGDFSYIYGLRHHSIVDLENAKKVFQMLNQHEKAEKTEQRINDLRRNLNLRNQ